MVTQFSDSSTAEGRLVIRLTNCHQNGLEAFAAFGVGVAVALASGVPAIAVAPAANAFLASRIAYTVVFSTDSLNGLLRSVVWLVGFLLIGWIFLLRP